MSMTTEAGTPAVSSEDFRAAILGTSAPVVEPAAAPATPAPAETPATPPAPTATATPTATAAETDAAPDPTTTELAALRAQLAKLEEEGKRREGQYTNNVTQQRQALEAAQKRADAAEKAAQDLSERQAKAAEEDWNSRVAQAQQRIRNEPDAQVAASLNDQLRVAIQQHDAEQRYAKATALEQAAAAKEAQLAPVLQELGGLQQQIQLKQFVDSGIQTLAKDGAQNLATETGIPVEEVRAYLQRPAITERLSRALALTEYARVNGQPIPRVFEDLGEQIRDHFVDLAAARTATESRLIAGNQQALVASGATRGDGGGGGTAPPRQINTMSDVTSDDFARAMGLRR